MEDRDAFRPVRFTPWAVLSVLCVSAGAAHAADPYPARPIRVLVGFTPGGAADGSARAVARRMAESMKAIFVIENRPGAGGNIAAEIVARASPDGHSLFWANLGPVVISPAMGTKLPYDPARDFAPVGQAVNACNVLVARPALGVANVAELLAMARARPGKLNYASQGVGSTGHLAGELFTGLSATHVVHVPYKGGAEAMTGLLAGEVEVAFVSVTATKAVGPARALPLGVTCAKRDPGLPNVPTLAEAGIPGYEASFWYGLLAPAGTPAAIIERLNREMRAALTDPQLIQSLEVQGLVAAPTSAQAYAQIIRDDFARWRKVLARKP